jgi:hypothetical protein
VPGEGRHVDRAAVGGVVAAGELEQVVDQLLEALDLLDDEAGGDRRARVEVLAAVGEHTGGRGQGLQRRAQLVAHVGSEAAVSFEAAGELVDHPVERGGEPGEVGFRGRIQPGVHGAAADFLSGVGDRRQRTQHVTAGVPAERGSSGCRHDRDSGEDQREHGKGTVELNQGRDLVEGGRGAERHTDDDRRLTFRPTLCTPGWPCSTIRCNASGTAAVRPASASRAYQRPSRRSTAPRLSPVSSVRSTSTTSGRSPARSLRTATASKYAIRIAVRSRSSTSELRVSW